MKSDHHQPIVSDLDLLRPTDGSVTDPLQQHPWPPDAGPSGEQHAEGGAAVRWDALEIMEEDRSLPRPITFAWRAPPGHDGALRYDLSISRTVDFGDARRVEDLTATEVAIPHLHLGAPYFWKVTAMDNGRPVAESATRRFTTDRTPPRWIHVPGITNVRDLGGWRLPDGGAVRQGSVYRSSEMDAHLQITAEGRRVLIDELGIRTDLDLRRLTEVAGPVLDAERVQWIHVPVDPYGSLASEEETGREAYRRVFEVFADPGNYPILFHCWGGADRGGTVAFLLGALVGMAADDLARDYELTSLSIWGERSRESEEFVSLLRALALFGDDGDSINQRAEHYARAIGVTASQIQHIRDVLVGEPGKL